MPAQSSESNVELDCEDFLIDMNKLKTSIKPASEKASGDTGMMILYDAIHKTPQVPVWDHLLRGSGIVYVDNNFYDFSKWGNIDAESIAARSRSPGASLAPDETVASITFNKPYAALWHEREPKHGFTWREAGSKYLESKITIYVREYVANAAKVFVDELRRRFGR